MNTALTNISFGTLHVYPQALGVSFSSSGDTDNYTWVNDNFIQPRAATAARLGKPFILEEFGLTPDYGLPNNISNARSVFVMLLSCCAFMVLSCGVLSSHIHFQFMMSRVPEVHFLSCQNSLN